MIQAMSSDKKVPLVALAGVSKGFKVAQVNPFAKKNAIEVLKSVDIDIAEGEITCLLGPNGAGKTTLLKILASLIVADHGDIRYRGQSPSDSARAMNGHIGIVTPNERSFYWRLTGRQNLRFFGSLYNLRGRTLDERVSEVLSDTGLTDAADKPYRLYSAGMKQKLNIARAAIGRPELYLLDEPASHLDPFAREEFWAFVRRNLVERQGRTVFLCTHDLEEARILADSVVVLDKGSVKARGTIGELGRLTGGLARLILTFAGEIPASWLAEHEGSTRLESDGSLSVSYDGNRETQEAMLRSFVSQGGRLLSAVANDGDLRELLHRTAGG